jgi:LysM repeat protein
MKKLIALLLIASVVGIILSRSDDSEPNASRTHDGLQATPHGPTVPLAAKPKPPAPAATPETEDEPDVASAPTAPTPPPPLAEKPLAEALALLKAGKPLEARKHLTALYLKAKGKDAAAIARVLDKINAELVFNPRRTTGAVVYRVQRGDNMIAIGGKHKVNWRQIARLNGIKPDDILKLNRPLKIITGKPSLIVWKSEFRMTLFIDGIYIKQYMVGIGLDDKTPTGEFVIGDRMIRAPWTTPDGRVLNYGDAGYRLGERWIAFQDQPGASGLGIHGTHDEASIGTKCSNGCLRMKNAEVVELYDFVTRGSAVDIRP